MDKVEKYLEAIKKLTKKTLRSKRASRKFLISTGIYNKDGSLHSNYSSGISPMQRQLSQK